MTGFFTCLISAHGLAYLTGAVIFLITLFLAAKRFIGLGVTFILLLFAIVAAQLVANQEAIKKYFNGDAAPSSEYKSGTTPPKEKADINAELQKAFDELKADFLIEKEKLKHLYDQITDSSSNNESTSNDTQNKINITPSK